MRTTITLERDVLVQLKRLQAQHKSRFKDLVNEALRLGLARLEAPKKRAARYRIRPASLGKRLVGSLDDISEILAVVESETPR